MSDRALFGEGFRRVRRGEVGLPLPDRAYGVAMSVKKAHVLLDEMMRVGARRASDLAVAVFRPGQPAFEKGDPLAQFSDLRSRGFDGPLRRGERRGRSRR